jgi:5-methylcytosine-specific restriction endonuclease McrA
MAFVYVAHCGPVVSRADAKAAGLMRFFTGKPCKHGHLSERMTCNGACYACNILEQAARFRTETPEARAVRNARQKAWKDAHREQVRAEGRAYSKANREQGQAWKAANRDKLNAAEREARKRNPETYRAYVARYLASERGQATRQAYADANPELLRAIRNNRRALLKAAEGTHTAEDIKRIGAAQKWRCHWCAKPVGKNYEVDHIRPISKGGSNWPRNLCIACRPCNRRKRASDPVAFAQGLGLLL